MIRLFNHGRISNPNYVDPEGFELQGANNNITCEEKKETLLI